MDEVAEKEVLDLDELLPKPKEIKIGGKAYNIADPTVEKFLQTVELQAQMKGKEGEELIPLIRSCISMMVPDLPMGLIEKMTYKQLTAALVFVTKDVSGKTNPKNEGASVMTTEGENPAI